MLDRLSTYLTVVPSLHLRILFVGDKTTESYAYNAKRATYKS
ncbi:hypothetical protein B4090_3519 [Bacillus licheniformis]|nr:hypothetical protein B4090_3519 [Bacillus licheniformis]